MARFISEVYFSRGEAAQILSATAATVANREKSGIYPEPKRAVNGYRIYTLKDIMDLQLITYQHVNVSPIIETLYDKGYIDKKEIAILIDKALKEKTL